MLENTIKDLIHRHLGVVGRISEETILNIESAIGIITNSFKCGNKLLIFGNGGSAADAQHLAAEFVNKFKLDRRPLSAIALTTDTSVLTSISNDSGYKYVFSKQIEALGREGDVALVITTSDFNGAHSENLYFAIKKANEKNLSTIGLLSKKSKNITDMLDLSIVVLSKETARIQEGHMLIYHIICELVERELCGGKS